LDQYSLLVTVLDDGEPPRESSKQIDVIFPTIGGSSRPVTTPSVTKTTEGKPREGVAVTTAAAGDNMLTIVMGAIAGVLMVVIIILIVYIVWK
jgi:hypothetical protein